MNRRGSSLLAAIGALVVMALLCAGIVLIVSTGLLESVESVGSANAFYGAETGLSLGKAFVTTNAFWYTNTPYAIAGSIGRASFAVSIVSTNNLTATIASVGRFEQSEWTSVWQGTGAYPRAMAVYQQTGQVRPRHVVFTSAGFVSPELAASSVAALPRWQRIEAHPTRNEFLLVAQNANRGIYAQAWTNDAWFGLTQLNAAGLPPNTAARGFDLAHEDLSGRGMVVYSIGTAVPQHRLWDGTNWTGPQPVNGLGAPQPIRWVRLVPKMGSNEIMLLVRCSDTGTGWNYSYAAVWDGAAWGNVQALEACASEANYETMDAAYTANSAVAVYINGATATARRFPKYRVYAAGVWGAEGSVNAATRLPAAPRWVRVESRAGTTNAFAAFLTTGRSFRGSYWNETAWSAYETFQNATLDNASYRGFDIAWCSQTNLLMVVYCKNQNAHSYMVQTQGLPAVYGTLPATDDGRWSVVKKDPYSPDFLYLAIDDRNDVNLQRWDGATWNLLPELETSSSASYGSVDIAFRRVLPP
jgi:hypothetical protein